MQTEDWQKEWEYVVSRLSEIPKMKKAHKYPLDKAEWKRFEIRDSGNCYESFLAESIKPNSSTTFTMEWDANIPMQIRRAGRNNREGVDMTMTQWYPKIAEYDYDGWAALIMWEENFTLRFLIMK
jgi:hypothetical protein